MNSPGQRTADLIREKGYFGLCYSDGCPCMQFEVHNIRVSVSCHKSEHTIRVSGETPGIDEADLALVVDAVKDAFAQAYHGHRPDDYAVVTRACP